MIGRATYGHGAVVRAILARERCGSGQPGSATPSRGSVGASSLTGSLGAAHDRRTYDRESDGGPLEWATITLEHFDAGG